MAKKTTNNEEEINNDYIPGDEALSAASFLGDEEQLEGLNFDVDAEYKPDPLIPGGRYHGVATKVTYKPDRYCISWDFCLHDNGGIMSDDETPIDGAHVIFNNWLPKPEDESVLTKSGKTNKRQSKLNMLKDFKDTLEIAMNTPTEIVTALNEGHWIGIEADLEITVEEYQGRFKNTVNRVYKSSF